MISLILQIRQNNRRRVAEPLIEENGINQTSNYQQEEKEYAKPVFRYTIAGEDDLNKVLAVYTKPLFSYLIFYNRVIVRYAVEN